MAQRSDGSKSSPHTARPDPCDRCQLSSCSVLHDCSASNCPYNLCPECHDLEVLDAQIVEIHNLLIDLSHKRREVKNRMNRRHDRFSSRLPLEVISHIFTHLADDSLSSLIMLGGVSRRWREITLDTPQLWTKIRIDRSNPQAKSFPNIIALWASQSCGLPLSLELMQGVWNQHSFPDVSHESLNVVSLLRSQVNRCKNLKIELYNTRPVLLDTLLMGLEDNLIVDSLTLHSGQSGPFDVVKITMKCPFVPKYLDIYDFPMSWVPIEWGSLTHLNASRISMDALIHIFNRAHNLQYCFLQSVEKTANHYPIPNSPVTNISIKELDLGQGHYSLDGELLTNHLTFPSLETLHEHLASDRYNHTEKKAVIALTAFLDRSSPPLNNFYFTYGEREWLRPDDDPGCYHMLPSITSLRLGVVVEDKGQRLQDYLEQFASHVEPRALPCLRELEITSKNMLSDSWSGLARIFSDKEDDNTMTEFAGVPRPLKTVTIRTKTSWDLTKQIMPKVIYTCLRTIQESGVALRVFDMNGVDVLGPYIQLTFDEFGNESNNKGLSETRMGEGAKEE